MPHINIGKYVLFERNYRDELKEKIKKMRRILMNSDYFVSESDVTTLNNYSPVEGNDVYTDVKEKIKNELVTQYGENICVDFVMDDNNGKDFNKIVNGDHHKTIYSLKVKEISNCDPDPCNFNESDICINAKNKKFFVKKGNAFIIFDLHKKTVIKCK
jgi:hypothetical protein